MAYPECPHCNGRFYELALIEPTGSNYKTNLVICSNCGAPAGALEYYDAGSLIREQGDTIDALTPAIAKLQKSIDDLSSLIMNVERFVYDLVGHSKQVCVP